MSEEMDRKIAERVMEEPEPDPPSFPIPYTYDDPHASAWRIAWRDGSVFQVAYWKPAPFSTDLDLAMRAAYHHFGDRTRTALRIEFEGSAIERPWAVFDWDRRTYVFGSTLPEAICNFLLALVEEQAIENLL